MCCRWESVLGMWRSEKTGQGYLKGTGQRRMAGCYLVLNPDGSPHETIQDVRELDNGQIADVQQDYQCYPHQTSVGTKGRDMKLFRVFETGALPIVL